METRIFKIGEDFIIGQVGDQAGEGRVKILHPLLVLVTDKGAHLLNFFAILTDDTELVVEKTKISFDVNAAEEILEVYNKALKKSPIVELSKKLVY